jgi:hydroxyquinol 1,2-dioxygenase
MKDKAVLSRRDALLKCAALGSLAVVAPSLGLTQAVSAWMAQEQGGARTPTQVFGTRGNALAGASIEIWQADHHGLYDLDGYRYRAALKADAAGAYAFDSIMPGHYPARVCQHIHYVVTAPGHKPLITQLYFATDPVFDGDPDRNYSKDPLVLSRELVRPVTLAGDPKVMQAKVSFDLVLERL